MPKIAIIGAGGYVFPLTLIRDILSFEALQESVISLYDIDPTRAAITEKGAQGLVQAHHLGATIQVPPNRREALAGADFVICTFQVGGIKAYGYDVTIPREFGIDQTVGDTLGPGGIFRGLRSIAALREITTDMKELCPSALLIQYANPMAVNCWATEALGVRTVGLCHSVQHTSRLLARELQVPYNEVTFDCAGVNHTAWFTTFRHGHEDLLGRIRAVMNDRHGARATAVPASELSEEEIYQGRDERVRTELMNLTGYFHTESSHHASEYWAWFRKNPALVSSYLPARWDYFDICTAHPEDHNVDAFVEESRQAGLTPSDEYGAYIIDSITTGTERVIYGNVPNHGLISNLPAGSCVEVACLVSDLGVRPIAYGELPAACAALNTVQINVQSLVVHAALEASRELVYAAAALDPLTSALLTLPQIRDMVDRLFAAEAPWLGELAG
jgi:alpha-galactosidase